MTLLSGLSYHRFVWNPVFRYTDGTVVEVDVRITPGVNGSPGTYQNFADRPVDPNGKEAAAFDRFIEQATSSLDRFVGEVTGTIIEPEADDSQDAHMTEFASVVAELEATREALSFACGHDRSGLDHLAEMQAMAAEVDPLRSDNAALVAQVGALEAELELANRHHVSITKLLSIAYRDRDRAEKRCRELQSQLDMRLPVIYCDDCLKPMTSLGALSFSPPDAFGAVTKRHHCGCASSDHPTRVVEG